MFYNNMRGHTCIRVYFFCWKKGGAWKQRQKNSIRRFDESYTSYKSYTNEVLRGLTQSIITLIRPFSAASTYNFF